MQPQSHLFLPAQNQLHVANRLAMCQYCEEFTIRQYEVTKNLLVRIQTICNFMEEAAGNHADILGLGWNQLSEKNLSWVMAKMRIRIHKLPRVGDTVTLCTWPSGASRLQYHRDFSLYSADKSLLVAATTQWVVLDIAERKITQCPMDFTQFLKNIPKPAIEDATIRIPSLQSRQPGPSFPVRHADIDQNNHVNNVRYVDFVLEAASTCPIGDKSLLQIDLIFRAEARAGDVINSSTAVEDQRLSQLSLVHSLYRGDTELVRARTVWNNHATPHRPARQSHPVP